jgi:hypothetical protein
MILLFISIALVSVLSAQQATEKSKRAPSAMRTHFIVALSDVK